MSASLPADLPVFRVLLHHPVPAKWCSTSSCVPLEDGVAPWPPDGRTPVA